MLVAMRGSAVFVAAMVAACSAGPFTSTPVDGGADAAPLADASPDAPHDSGAPISLFQFFPSSIDFGYQPVGSFVSQVNLAINNEGTAPIHGFALSLSGPNAA